MLITNHGFRESTGGNGRGSRSELDRQREVPQSRGQSLKYAVFYLAVAILLFLAGRLAQQPRADRTYSGPVLNVGFELSLSHDSEATHERNDTNGGTPHVIRVRVSNRGNRSVFYPIYNGTSRPVGYVVYRAGPGSEWVPVPSSEGSTGSPQPSITAGVTWIEMPPGGWVDGMYSDSGRPDGDHAYEIELKVSTQGEITRLFSQAYRLNSQ